MERTGPGRDRRYHPTGIRQRQDESKGFLEDSKLSVLNKNYTFYRNFLNNPGGQNYRNETAHGIMADYQSGYTQGTVGFGVDAHGMLGIKLNSGNGTNGTGLMPTGSDGRSQDDYSYAGGAVKARISNTELKYGNLMPANPCSQWAPPVCSPARLKASRS